MYSRYQRSSHRLQQRFRLLCGILLFSLLIGCGVVNPPAPTAIPHTPTASITPTPTITETPTPSLTPTATEPPVLCGGPPLMSILLVGSDARRDSYAIGLADAMKLVRVDFVEPSIQVLSFPRDLYVEIPGIEDHGGITHGKLNQAYLYGNPGFNYFDGPGQGPGLLAVTLEHNFGAQVDHHVAVNLQTFVRIVDALGGLDISLPYAIDGRVPGSRDPDRLYPAGEQHLNGYRTMLLARLRPQGDLQRAEIQDLILRALAEALFDPSTILEFPQLIESFQGSIQTDLGPREIRQLLCLRRELDLQKVNLVNFPDDLFKSERVRDPVLGNTSILAADFDVLQTYVQKFQEGLWRRSDQRFETETNP